MEFLREQPRRPPRRSSPARPRAGRGRPGRPRRSGRCGRPRQWRHRIDQDCDRAPCSLHRQLLTAGRRSVSFASEHPSLCCAAAGARAYPGSKQRPHPGGDDHGQARTADDRSDDAPCHGGLRGRLPGASLLGGRRPRRLPAPGRALHPGHLHRRAHGGENQRCDDGALSQPQDHRQLRRRLRLHRRGGGGAPRRDHHQHARRADRGGGGHRARPAAHHGARVLPGRAVAARRALGQGRRLPPHPGLAARPLGGHRRPRPHRQGHRPAPGGVRPARAPTSAAASRPA